MAEVFLPSSVLEMYLLSWSCDKLTVIIISYAAHQSSLQRDRDPNLRLPVLSAGLPNALCAQPYGANLKQFAFHFDMKCPG